MLKLPAGCTAALPEKDELAPGESTNLNVTFNSAGRFGKQKKLIRIESNDPDNPQVIVTIKGKCCFIPMRKVQLILFCILVKQSMILEKVQEGKVVEYTFTFEKQWKVYS